MKKKVIGLTVWSTLLAVLCLGAFVGGMCFANSQGAGYDLTAIGLAGISVFPHFFQFTGIQPMMVAALCAYAVVIIIWFLWFVLLITHKNSKYVVTLILSLLSFALLLYFCNALIFNIFDTSSFSTSFPSDQCFLFYVISSAIAGNIATSDIIVYVTSGVSVLFGLVSLILLIVEFFVVAKIKNNDEKVYVDGGSKDDIPQEVASIDSVQQYLDNEPTEEEKKEPVEQPIVSSQPNVPFVVQVQNDNQLSESRIREIIQEELAKFFKDYKPATTEVSDDEEGEEEVSSKKIIRIPFATRCKSMSEEMRKNFNELKAEILSYGVKSRVSNSGDYFRLHTKTYVKMNIAGNSLKLYFALDPKDYKDTTYPVKDVSSKAIYKEIPLCMRVKSGLSLRRAKALIADTMLKDKLEKGEVKEHDYVKDIIKTANLKKNA